MQCCQPALLTVPEGDFYCFDCSTHGATSTLQAYLDDMETARDRVVPPSSTGVVDSQQQQLTFVDQMIIQDALDHKAEYLIPSSQDWSEEAKISHILATVRPPCSELEALHDNPSALIGKAILLHCPTSNDYHTGRILQARRITRESSSADDDDDGNGSSSKQPNDDEAIDSECLVRFPAGRDNRKTTLTCWMRLEEHSLALATEWVWGLQHQTRSSSAGTFPEPQGWMPCKLWLRSSRELIVSINMLDAKLDQIRFRDWRRQNETPRMAVVKRPEKRPHTWILAEFPERFSYKLLHVGKETRRTSDLTSSSSEPPVKEHLLQAMKALERAEQEEQDRVRAWNEVPLVNTLHEKAISCQDEFSIPPLSMTTHELKKTAIQPSPLIQTGLDRLYILDRVAPLWEKESRRAGLEIKDGEYRTKDVALSLSCTLMEAGALTSCIQSFNQS